MGNIEIFNAAVGEDNGLTSFFEFPNLFSEFNSMDLSQYQHEKWFSKNKPQEVSVNTITLDELLVKQAKEPDIIKIDVEGGEHAVIKGAASLLSQEKAPLIVMEYLTHSRHNIPHRKAAQQLAMFGYQPFLIQDNGEIVETEDIENHLLLNNLESDNIVFKRSMKLDYV